MAISYRLLVVIVSIAYLIGVHSVDDDETWTVQNAEVDSEYFKQEIARLSEKPNIKVPIKVRVLYNILASHSTLLMRLFHNMIRDTRAWKPVMSVCIEDCELEAPCNTSVNSASFEVTCSGVTSIHEELLDEVTSSKELRRMVLEATDRCNSEFDEGLQIHPYDLVKNLSMPRWIEADNRSIVMYLDSPKMHLDGGKNMSRRLIRELWLDSLNQTNLLFIWAESEAASDELHVIGRYRHVGFFDDEATWPNIEQGMRVSFHNMYELAEPHNETDEGLCADLVVRSSSATKPRLLILSLLSVFIYYVFI